MMLFAFAAVAAVMQWTGPRTEAYVGPGFFCGGGYAVRLARGERALILPQGRGAPSARVVIGGREVNIWTGAAREPGRLVSRYPGGAITQSSSDGGIAYTVSDQTDFALRVTSDAFRGFKRDGWFFTRANFTNGVDDRVRCLASQSY
jgi:hypothetical protein